MWGFRLGSWQGVLQRHEGLPQIAQSWDFRIQGGPAFRVLGLGFSGSGIM